MKNPTAQPDCDCLNYCGADPRVAKGSVKPCNELQLRQAFSARCAAAGNLLRNGHHRNAGGATAQIMVPTLQARLDMATDRLAFWRELLAALATLAVADIGGTALAAVLVDMATAATIDEAGEVINHG